MKATRRELMSFFDYVVKRMGQSERFNREIVTDDYMKLINSEAGDETPTVTDNEHQEKVYHCQSCGYVIPEHRHGCPEYYSGR
jgi:rubrerythrin